MQRRDGVAYGVVAFVSSCRAEMSNLVGCEILSQMQNSPVVHLAMLRIDSGYVRSGRWCNTDLRRVIFTFDIYEAHNQPPTSVRHAVLSKYEKA